MFYRERSAANRDRFYRLTAPILDTAPMPVIEAPWSIVTMISNNDVQMYLLSMKSFYAKIRRGKLIAIVDRDMPDEKRETLGRHFPGIRFVILEDIDTGACQRGGTWERLVYVLDNAHHEYTVQIDCDTLTFGTDVSEVIRCIEANVAFTLSGSDRSIVTMEKAAELAKATKSDYVGIVAERAFDQYPAADRVLYTRGSSGFAGFAKNGFPRRDIEKFHESFRSILGSRWDEWGSEQCGSNFAVANSPGAIVLPFPKYGNFGPRTVLEDCSFLHFIGTFRYLNDSFANTGLKVIADLSGQIAG